VSVAVTVGGGGGGGRIGARLGQVIILSISQEFALTYAK
jgi:hypothetical protein